MCELCVSLQANFRSTRVQGPGTVVVLEQIGDITLRCVRELAS